MKADTDNLQGVLQGERRFVIPVYQRPYVWTREQQWEPLWTDVESTALRLVETRIAAHQAQDPEARADAKAPPHFLGAIVVEPFPTGALEIKTSLVVDGQQRLVTLQLLLMGALDALRSCGTSELQIARLRNLTRNDETIWSGEDVYKVWPRQAEREKYVKAVAKNPCPPDDSEFAAARKFFADEAIDFLEDEGVPEDPYVDGDPIHRRAALLVSTLISLVKLVVIDLEDVDDAQVIFEALNARNTPLSATDLIKNLLFMRAQATGHDPQKLYDEVWARFDKADEWWRESIGAGHARRARQDWLMGDWLIAQRGRVINVGRLYGEFRNWLHTSGTTAFGALRELDKYADAYERLHGRIDGATETEQLVFQRIDSLNVTVATPILLWLLTRAEAELPPEEREMAFKAIESFVIRRMAVKAQTRAYGQAFAEVLRVAQEADTHPGYAILNALRRGPYGYPWPSDSEMVRQFRTSAYYGYGGIARYRLRLLLGAVDAKLQRVDHHKGEPIKQIAYDSLEIEHVLPVSWKEHWSVEGSNEGETIKLEMYRQDHIHCIGNLTLVSSSLNPAMKNAPWNKKRQELKKHSHLRLNARLCQQIDWNEHEIKDRGEWLALEVADIWSGPDSEKWAKQ